MPTIGPTIVLDRFHVQQTADIWQNKQTGLVVAVRN